MTVWTPVSLEQAQVWLQERDLGSVRSITPVEDGVEDSVFRLETMEGASYCLRLFERTQADGPLGLALRLAAHGLPACAPIEDSQKRVLVTLNAKPAALFPWIDGAWKPSPTFAQIEAVGAFLGRMGRVGLEHCADWSHENPRGWRWFEETAQSLSGVIDAETWNEIHDELSAQRAYWQDQEGRDIPRGPVHADLFRNNVMFHEDGSLGAVIDWGFCASDCPLVYDLAIVANDWCLQDQGHGLDASRLAALFSGYNKSRTLTRDEEKAWVMALRWAALRFTLSRLHDHHFPRDPNGKTLDPDHFYKIFTARRRLA